METSNNGDSLKRLKDYQNMLFIYCKIWFYNLLSSILLYYSYSE